MTDVFNAMTVHIDAITEHLTAIEIEEKAGIDLVRARKWKESCGIAAIAMQRKRENTESTLCMAINTARKDKPKTGE